MKVRPGAITLIGQSGLVSHLLRTLLIPPSYSRLSVYLVHEPANHHDSSAPMSTPLSIPALVVKNARLLSFTVIYPYSVIYLLIHCQCWFELCNQIMSIYLFSSVYTKVVSWVRKTSYTFLTTAHSSNGREVTRLKSSLLMQNTLPDKTRTSNEQVTIESLHSMPVTVYKKCFNLNIHLSALSTPEVTPHRQLHWIGLLVPKNNQWRVQCWTWSVIPLFQRTIIESPATCGSGTRFCSYYTPANSKINYFRHFCDSAPDVNVIKCWY